MGVLFYYFFIVNAQTPGSMTKHLRLNTYTIPSEKISALNCTTTRKI